MRGGRSVRGQLFEFSKWPSSPSRREASCERNWSVNSRHNPRPKACLARPARGGIHRTSGGASDCFSPLLVVSLPVLQRSQPVPCVCALRLRCLPASEFVGVPQFSALTALEIRSNHQCFDTKLVSSSSVHIFIMSCLVLYRCRSRNLFLNLPLTPKSRR